LTGFAAPENFAVKHILKPIDDSCVETLALFLSIGNGQQAPVKDGLSAS